MLSAASFGSGSASKSFPLASQSLGFAGFRMPMLLSSLSSFESSASSFSLRLGMFMKAMIPEPPSVGNLLQAQNTSRLCLSRVYAQAGCEDERATKGGRGKLLFSAVEESSEQNEVKRALRTERFLK